MTTGTAGAMSGRVAGKAAVVTGAGQGQGAAETRLLAAEGARHGIRANCISPGMIRTPASDSTLLAPDRPMRSIARHIPLVSCDIKDCSGRLSELR